MPAIDLTIYRPSQKCYSAIFILFRKRNDFKRESPAIIQLFPDCFFLSSWKRWIKNEERLDLSQ